MPDTAVMDAPGTDTSSEFSMLGEALDSAIETTPEEQPAEQAQEQIPPGEAPTPEPETAQPEQAPPGEAPTYEATPDGKGFIVPKEEVAAFTGLRKYADEVQQMFPTANDAKLSHQESSMYRHLLSDYLYGDEGSAVEVLKFWAGENATSPQYKQESQQAFMRLAQAMPDVLRQVNPEAHQAFAAKVAEARINDAYEQARLKGNPDDPNDPLLLKAQRMEWAEKGTYRTNDPNLRQQFGVEGIKRHDPNQAVQEQVTRQQQELANREKAMLERDFKSFNREQMDGPKWTAYGAEIDKILSSHKNSYQAPVFAAIREKIDKDLQAKLQNDFEWARTHSNERRALTAAYEQAWRNGQPTDALKQRIQAYQNDFLSRARRYLPSIAKQYLNAATAQAVNQNAQQRAQNGRFTTKPATTPAPANGQQAHPEDFRESDLWKNAWK